jgi:hypothetical protein
MDTETNPRTDPVERIVDEAMRGTLGRGMTASKPLIAVPNVSGFHNSDIQAAYERLERGKTYKDLSTVIVTPTRGSIPARVVQSWMSLMRPMNQRVPNPIFVSGMEVGDAYNAAVEMLLASEFANWTFLLTLEEDNCPPPDALLLLYEAIEGSVDSNRYDAVGGLYWTKGPGGQPMCYGDPEVLPVNFIPQIPRKVIQPCRGLGMGFTLFRIAMFKDPRLKPPYFKTVQEYREGQGARQYTQDLMFFERAVSLGYTFAVDSRCKVGHYDYDGVFGQPDMMW